MGMKPRVGAERLQNPRRRNGSDFKADPRELGARKQRGGAADAIAGHVLRGRGSALRRVTAAPNHVAARLNSGASDGKTVNSSA